jgi:hypothetical protein
MTGVFRTTLVDALHNLTCILPIEYTLKKLMHSHTLHLQKLPANTRVWTILSEDRCHYWPKYVQPTTILMRALGTYNLHLTRVEGQSPTDLRNTPRFMYKSHPSTLTKSHYKTKLRARPPHILHITISTTPYEGSHIAMYESSISVGSVCRSTRMHALSRAVYSAFCDAIPHLPHATVIWI